MRFLEIQSAVKRDHLHQIPHDGMGIEAGSLSDFLILKEKQDIASLSYVAVSYCWDRSAASWFYDRNSYHQMTIFQSGSLREMSDSDVLYRAFKFAEYHGCRNIWMGQFCIDQSDPVDKQDGIQAMDIVYQSSQYSVAILECYIDSQAKVNALASLFTGDMIELDRLKDLEEILDDLAEDAWFTRAWTLQEAVSAGSLMKVLLGCAIEAYKPEEFGSIPGEIETTIWDLQTAMVTARNWMEELFAAGVLEDDTMATNISNYADELFNMRPDILPAVESWSNSHPVDSSDRQICSAAELLIACRIGKILCSRTDWVLSVIFVTMKLGLKSDVLDDMLFSFSTCVHTLAILNGDTSLLGRYSDPYQRSYLSRDGRNPVGFQSDLTDSAMGFGFSWGSPPWSSLRNIEYFDQHDEPLKLTPAILTSKGLRVKGVLWSMKSSIDLSELQSTFCQ